MVKKSFVIVDNPSLMTAILSHPTLEDPHTPSLLFQSILLFHSYPPYSYTPYSLLTNLSMWSYVVPPSESYLILHYCHFTFPCILSPLIPIAAAVVVVIVVVVVVVLVGLPLPPPHILVAPPSDPPVLPWAACLLRSSLIQAVIIDPNTRTTTSNRLAAISPNLKWKEGKVRLGKVR